MPTAMARPEASASRPLLERTERESGESHAGRVLPAPHPFEELELATRVRLLSVRQWGEAHAVRLIGRDRGLEAILERAARFAAADAPVLIEGETGTGKELVARALYLLGRYRAGRFMAVNCAQYADNHLIASELFGHKRGSFTGAIADHRGVFEAAEGGVVFLDEVGELTLSAQAMLLRVLSEREVVPVGETRARPVDVRVVAATNRSLRRMVEAGQLREDLFFRLNCMRISIPPLRDRSDDWRLMLEYFARCLSFECGLERRFSDRSVERLRRYRWPGNVRELQSLVETSYHLSDGASTIEPAAFEERLDGHAPAPGEVAGGADLPDAILERISGGEGDFWSLVHDPFLARELNRQEVRTIIEGALERCHWSYKNTLPQLGLSGRDYLRFMDFLRHHGLKPERR